jgi:transketolase
MRWPFAQAVTALAERDPRVVLLMGDVGGGLFSTYAAKFPHRYFNLGTAEQSMVGIAAGMALAGMRPVVYSFTPFILERAYEQVKLDVALQRAPVLLAGWQDDVHGLTHQSHEAHRILATIVGLQRLYPETAAEIPALIARPDEWPAFLLLKTA